MGLKSLSNRAIALEIVSSDHVLPNKKFSTEVALLGISAIPPNAILAVFTLFFSKVILKHPQIAEMS